nr:hypothetical transcript [Hymenolepis microstoma]
MGRTFLNGLHHGNLFIGLIFLFIFPSETHAQSEGYTLKVDPEIHLNSLFAKYKASGSIRNEDLDHLISDTRNPVEKCFDAKNIVNGSLDKEALRIILPTLIFDLVEHDCHLNHPEANPEYASQNWKVWVASIIAVIIISFSGLLVVALVSKMSRKFYNVVTQFLIALSVGSLIGDTFLHLIPHALLSDGSSSHGHSHESNGKDE